MSLFLILVGATVYGLLVTALCHNVTCEVSETTMLQKRAYRRPRTNRSPNTEELLQHALEQEEKLKEIVGRLFHRLEMADVHVDIDTDAEAPIIGPRKIRNKDLFETCQVPRALTQTAHVAPSQRRDSQTKLSCSSGLPIFDLSQGDYVCCPTAALYCAGCFQLDGSSCAKCSPGFVEVAGEGRCESCVDTPGWTNLDGENCIQAVCSDTTYYGLSSNRACCGCGGGQRAATPFTYYVAPTVLYATSIIGFPVPRTAINYTINQDCKLLEHGLAIDGATGSLRIAPGADRVGGNLLEAFSISCTIVAHQTISLSASATLTVVAQKNISYGQYPYLVHATHLADEQQEDTLGIHPVDDNVRAIQNDYMISGFLVDEGFVALATLTGCDGRIHSPRIALICAIELLLLALLVAKAVTLFVYSLTSDLERARWTNACKFWWEVLPELTSFSAMRLLHCATPSVVLADVFSFAAYAGPRAELDGYATGFRLWMVFTLRKLMCLVIGIDAFLFKVRVAYSDIHKDELGPWSFLSLTMFIVQVLGIVQLSMFVRDRIFLFIFGGEDSIMQPAERALKSVWQAMVVRKVCQLFEWHKATAILITFDEDDFQKLVLNENGDIHESLMSTSVGSWDPLAESTVFASESLLSRISEDDKEEHTV